MDDLKHGNGLKPPANNPLERRFLFSHGWRSEQVDLARVALDELLRRDKLGKLSPSFRHQIDEMALANLYAPVGGPVDDYLNRELGDRLLAGRLTAAEESMIYTRAVTASLGAPAVVMQWDDVPIQVNFMIRLPSGWYVIERYKSVQIDGVEVHWSKKSPAGSDDLDINSVGHDNRLIPYSTLGRHRIRVVLQCDFHYGTLGGRGGSIHSELRTLSTTFVETTPTLLVEILRLLQDPAHESGHYLTPNLLSYAMANGSTSVRDLAATELVRRDTVDELTVGDRDRFVDQLLAIQKDRNQSWNEQNGDYIEGLRAAHKLSDLRWREYGAAIFAFSWRTRPEIREGDPLPLDVITYRARGNSRLGPFVGSQWTIENAVLKGETQPMKFGFWDDIDTTGVPNSGFDFATRMIVSLPRATLGRHALLGKLHYPSRTQLPPQIEIPNEFDLEEAEFSIVPRQTDTVKAVDDPSLANEIRRCIDISNLLRWKDGQLSLQIQLHHPPVDIAFHVTLEAGGREYTIGDIDAPKDGKANSIYTGFSVRDASQMPSKGLVFKFTSDSQIARRTVAIKSYWRGNITISGVPIRTDDYVKPAR